MCVRACLREERGGEAGRGRGEREGGREEAGREGGRACFEALYTPRPNRGISGARRGLHHVQVDDIDLQLSKGASGLFTVSGNAPAIGPMAGAHLNVINKGLIADTNCIWSD